MSKAPAKSASPPPGEMKVCCLEALQAHIQELAAVPGGLLPLSPSRLSSYLHNPRARPGDPLLFEWYIDARLVAFRSLLPDHFLDADNKPKRFAWLSGTYVEPAYRRRGISTILLKEAERRWQGRLMYTNYAPAAKALFDNSGHFVRLALRQGRRYYLRSDLRGLLGQRLGFPALLGAADSLLNWSRERKLRAFSPVDPLLCRVEEIEDPLAFFTPGKEKGQAPEAEAVLKKSLFNRDAPTLAWILKYPWLRTLKQEEANPYNYPFSYQAKSFAQRLFRFSPPGEQNNTSPNTNLLWLTVHNKKLSIPYLWYDNPETLPSMARHIVRFMIEEKLSYLTLRQEALLPHMKNLTKSCIATRNMPQQIFVHQSLGDLARRYNTSDKTSSRLPIFDGDGDVVFTG